MASIIELETSRLRMRQWRESDRAPFAAMNADPAVMEFFASPPSPAAGDASIDAWQAQFAAQGWLVRSECSEASNGGEIHRLFRYVSRAKISSRSAYHPTRGLFQRHRSLRGRI